MDWYRLHARVLPWRGIDDPYRTWVSEIMLQQTRVAAVIKHYRVFLERFPTLGALAAASEAEVLAAWSGLGYYRRARMLHRGAQFVMAEWSGVISGTAEALRKLPGVGEYTSAAIASIAFGESVAVVDGNVERVMLRLAGRPENATAAGRAWVRQQAAELVPAASRTGNAPGDHNQAMMELGATICLPRRPLCLSCPVYTLCATRAEHKTLQRAKAQSRPAAYLLHVDEGGVLLERRSLEASLMAGMYELPSLPVDAGGGRGPVLRLRHSITNTVYAVAIYGAEDGSLCSEVAARQERLSVISLATVATLPLTGLARKVLRRLKLMG